VDILSKHVKGTKHKSNTYLDKSEFAEYILHIYRGTEMQKMNSTLRPTKIKLLAISYVQRRKWQNVPLPS